MSRPAARRVRKCECERASPRLLAFVGPARRGRDCAPDGRACCLALASQLLGTPNDNTWENVSKLPDWQSRFPAWRPKDFLKDYAALGSSGVDLLRQLLAYDPRLRIVAKVRSHTRHARNARNARDSCSHCPRSPPLPLSPSNGAPRLQTSSPEAHGPSCKPRTLPQAMGPLPINGLPAVCPVRRTRSRRRTLTTSTRRASARVRCRRPRRDRRRLRGRLRVSEPWLASPCLAALGAGPAAPRRFL
jgi:hypothetical protein